MIKITNLTKIFKEWNKENEVFKNLDFSVKKWDFIAIIWKSGSGKTSLLNMISWVIWFESWEISIWDKDLSKMKIDEKTKFRWKNFSFVFQEFHLIQNLNVEENIELTIDINKIEKRFSVEEVLKKVWLENKKESYPYNLSGWEKQRVAIARAFIWVTPIILADEPTWNLDEENSKNIMEILTNLHKETKNTIILITHEKSIAKYANKIYKLEEKSLKEVK